MCVFLWFIFSFFPYCLSVSVKWLAVKTASEMTYTVSGGALNSAQSNPAIFQSVIFISPACVTWSVSLNMFVVRYTEDGHTTGSPEFSPPNPVRLSWELNEEVSFWSSSYYCPISVWNVIFAVFSFYAHMWDLTHYRCIYYLLIHFAVVTPGYIVSKKFTFCELLET